MALGLLSILMIFLTNSFLMFLCMPAESGVADTDRLLRPAFGVSRVGWPGDPGVEFHLSHGEWIELLRRSGFVVEALHELRAPEVASTHTYYDWMPVEWARRWPAEDLWVARKAARFPENARNAEDFMRSAASDARLGRRVTTHFV